MQNHTRFIFKQGIIYGIGNLLVKLSGVILIPLYFEYISKEEYGVVTLFETIFQFILILSGWGIKGGFMRWYNDMEGVVEKKKLFFTSWSFNFGTTLLTVVTVGTFLFIFSYDIFQYTISSSTILFFVSATFFRLMFDLPHYLLKLEQKAVTQTWWMFLNIVLLVGATYYFLEFKDMGLEGIYLGQLVAHSLTFLALLPLIIKNSLPQLNRAVLKNMLHYGLPLAISNILSTILTLSDRHIINQVHNLNDVAGYSMGYKVANLIQMIVVASFITGYTNYYFKTMHESGSQLFYQKIVRYFIVLISLAGLGIVLFSPEVIYVVSRGSQEFQSSLIIIPVLMIGMIFAALRQIFTLPLNKHKRTRRISLILVLSATVNLAGNLILVPLIGNMGASVSTVMAQLFAFIWFFSEVRKTEPLGFSAVSNLILFAVWCILAYTGTQFFHLPLMAAWGVKIALLLIFIAVLFVTGHINRNELSELSTIYKKITGR